MNGGNAFIGFLVLVGAAQMVGWEVAALIAAAILLEGLLWRGGRMVGRRITQPRPFQSLSPLEQGLRRGSQGFAVMVFAGVAAAALVWFFGWPGFGR